MKCFEFGLLRKIKMVEHLQPMKKGIAELQHFEISEETVRFEKLRALMNYSSECVTLEAGKYCRLIVDNKLVMSDTGMEKDTNFEFTMKANGHVLIAGLGLGMILKAVENYDCIKSITVIEKEQDVIDIINPQLKLHSNVNIICADIFEWVPLQGMKYDVIYFDIWSEICGDNYTEMKRLHRKFCRKLNRDNPECYMNSWRRNCAKKLYKQSEDRKKINNMFRLCDEQVEKMNTAFDEINI